MKIFLAFIVILILGYHFAVRPLIVNPISAELQNRLATTTQKQKSLPDPKELRSHVDQLTGIQPYRNMANPESLNRAAAYIRSQWEGMGFQVSEQKFMAEGKEYANLIAEVGPSSDEIFVVGAHYDVCEDQPGADDNASGVSGLLELSRILMSKKNELKSRIQLVAYTLEEPPAYATANMGSLHHARMLKDAGIKVKLMLSLEMIGYFSKEAGSQNFPIALLKLHYPTTGDFIALVSNTDNRAETLRAKELMMLHSDIPVHSINSPELVPGIDYSDHRSFWAMGYPAVMITDTSFYRNFNYHKASDTAGTLDYSSMAEVVSGVAGILLGW